MRAVSMTIPVIMDNKAEMNWRYEELYTIRIRGADFIIYPAGFRSCFGHAFPHYAPLSLILNENVHSVTFYCKCNLFFNFTGG